MVWPSRIPIAEEPHFGDRVVRCFAGRPRDVYALLEDALGRDPEATAYVAGLRRVDYGTLVRDVERVAAGMASLGIEPGDRVALLAPNCPEFLVAVFAVLRIGAVLVPVGTRLAAPEIEYLIEHSGASAAVHDAGLVDLLPDGLPLKRIALGRADDSADGVVEFDRLLACEDECPRAEPGEEAPAVLLYTSGTTGRPKGAVLTHLNIVHSVMHYEQCMGLGPDDRIALAVPATHVTGLVANLLSAVRAGASSVFTPPFKASSFLDLMERERVTATLLVPTMYNLCLLDMPVGARDLAAWRIGGYGGAPMPESTIAGLARALPGLSLMNVYGATETTSPATLMPPVETAARGDSVGLAVPCGELRIVDADGAEVAPGEPGELWIRGPMVVSRYWNDPSASADAFIDGWWRSGDVASIDEDGFVRLLDRMKDVINRGGYKIYCVEVENAIAHVPGVIECAVVPHPDPVLGERVHAVVVTHDRQLGPSKVRAACAARLADYKVPEHVSLRELPLPRNANGKVLKQRLLASVVD